MAGTAFLAFCDRQDWTPAFYQVADRRPYRKLGLRLVPIGSDAVIPTRSFSLQGKEHAALRSAIRRCEREGIRVVAHDRYRARIVAPLQA